jgi:hypothetical protein
MKVKSSACMALHLNLREMPKSRYPSAVYDVFCGGSDWPPVSSMERGENRTFLILIFFTLLC